MKARGYDELLVRDTAFPKPGRHRGQHWTIVAVEEKRLAAILRRRSR